MESDRLMELIRSRRSVRAFDRTRTVPREDLLRILEAGMWAPTGTNQQELRYVIVMDRQRIEEFARFKKIKTMSAVVLIYYDFETYYGAYDRKLKSRPHKRPLPYLDTGLAMMNMILVAESLGIRTVPLNVTNALSKDLVGKRRFFGKVLRGVARLCRRSWFGVRFFSEYTRSLGIDAKRYLPTCSLALGYSDQEIDPASKVYGHNPLMRPSVEERILAEFPREEDTP